MLVLSRRLDETVVVDGRIIIRVLEITNGRVRLGFQAPGDVRILRGELLELPPQVQPIRSTVPLLRVA